MDPRLGLGIHQYSLAFWTFTIEKVGKLCTLLMRREGGKYTKVPPSSWWGGKLIDVSIVVGGDADVVVSMWMPRWPPVQHIVFSRALAFEQPEPESRYSVAEAGLADARGCAAGADRTCADRSSIVRSTLQLTSACQPFSAVAREGAAVTLAFDRLVTFWGYCVASGRWSVVKLLRQVMKAQWRPFDATESAKSLPSLAEESVSKAGFSAVSVSVTRSLSEAGRQGPDVPSQPARGPLGSLHKGHCGRSSISAVVSSFSFSHFWQQQMIHHCEFTGLTVLSSIHLTAGPQLEPNEVD